jgi:glycosyltransferase involved in cell wall biosynthesis
MLNIKVYIDTPSWYIRPNNTDWQYTLSLKEMKAYAPLEFVYSKEYKLVLEENWHWFKLLISRLLKVNIKERCLSRSLSTRNLVKSSPDIVYSHSRLPLAGSTSVVPVIWFYGVVDPEMRIAAGQMMDVIEQEYREIERCFEAATAVLFPTKLMMKRLALRFPNYQDKFSYAPFFLNHIKVISQEKCKAKHADDNILKLLFVGREAKRKGLDIFLEAITQLPESSKVRLAIDVVTSDASFQPQFKYLTNVTWHKELSKSEVQALMLQAHVFVMPSRFESYGLVYIEAMAAGSVVLAPSWESQRELCCNGETGVLTDGTVTGVALALGRISDRTFRLTLAEKARHNCEAEYSPSAVAIAHYRAFEKAINGHAA